jgi:hypothetical protein
VTFDLPESVVSRLTAEADRRGVEVTAVIADLAQHLPPEGASTTRRRLAFIGVGGSGTGITPRMADLLSDGFGRNRRSELA